MLFVIIFAISLTIKPFIMETITKRFRTIKQAAKYQNSLYNKFPYVVLISSPLFSEEGQYTWEISM